MAHEHQRPARKSHRKAASHAHHPRESASAPLPRPSSEIEEGLRTIYEIDETQDHVDMSKLDIVAQPFVRRLLTALLLVLIASAAGLAGALFLKNPVGHNLARALAFDVHAPESTLVSGAETTIEIPYHNTSSVALAQIEVTLHAPKGFQVLSAEPQAVEEEPLRWVIGSLAPDAQGVIRLQGIFWGTPGSAITVQAVTRYTPANVTAPFEDIATTSFLIDHSSVTLQLDGPERAVPGEPATYHATIEQTGEQTLEHLVFQLDPLSGFELTHTSLEPSEETQARWSLPPLESHKPFTLELTGTFASDSHGEQTLQGHLSYQAEDLTITQATAEATSTVLASDLALSLVVNGEAGDLVLLPGDDLTVNISLSNRGEESAEEATVELFIDEGLSRVALDDRSGIPDGDRYGNKINWDKTDLGKLKTLRGGETASIDLAIPTAAEGASTIRLHAIARIKRVGGVDLVRELTSRTITARIASNIQATMRAQYYQQDGTAIGSGPMPPQLGEATTYRVTWVITNALNDAQDVVLWAPLGARAEWAGLVSTSQGTLSYDSIADRVRWSLGAVPAGSEPPRATFDIRVTPSKADLNQFADLLKPGKLTATDQVTQTDLVQEQEELTTELPNDPFAANQGVVIEATD